MPRSEMMSFDDLLAELSRKAKKDAVLVEDLLRIAACENSDAIPLLLQMTSEYSWPETNRIGRKRVVPLGLWVKVICHFLESGIAGLVQQLRSENLDTTKRELIFDVLKEIRRSESVDAVVTVGEEWVTSGVRGLEDLSDRSQLVADTLNELLCFDPPVPVRADQADRVRTLLHEVMTLNPDQDVLSSAYCASRAVGNEETIALIKSKPPLRGEWSGVERVAINAIRSQLRRRKTGD